MSTGYWDSFTSHRFSRRRALSVTGGVAASAALLAACGSSGSGSSGGQAQSSLVTKQADTGAQAKPGGVLKHFSTSDTLHFDSLSSNSAQVVANCSIYAYLRLLKFVPGKYPDAPEGNAGGVVHSLGEDSVCSSSFEV